MTNAPGGEATTTAGHRALKLIASVDDLARIRDFIREAVGALGGTPQAASDLVQAVDEAACNVIVHGYGGVPGELEIRAAALPGRRAEVRLLDRGRPFDPAAVPPVDTAAPVTPTRPGGMGVGVHLLRSLTDEVHHAVRPDGGNELILVRSLDDRADADRAEED